MLVNYKTFLHLRRVTTNRLTVYVQCLKIIASSRNRQNGAVWSKMLATPLATAIERTTQPTIQLFDHQKVHLKPNSITLAGSELVRSWFEAGSNQIA